MKRTSLLIGLFGLLAIVSLPASSALAQSRTYISTGGNDANNCFRSTPCRSFNGALAKTSAGGEINCLDIGNFGAIVSITKSITIDCTGTFGALENVNQSTGFTIEAAPTDKVTLKGLHINGGGAASLGHSGIIFITGGQLHVEDVTIENFTNTGIIVNKAAGGVTTVTIRSVSITRGKIGVLLQSTAPNIVAAISNSSFNGLSGNGVEAGANSYATVSNSVFSILNGSAIVASAATGTVYAIDNVISNSWVGISASVSGAKVSAAIGNKIVGNSKAFNVAAGATFLSSGSNAIDINPGNPPTGSITWR